jgi:hypothetical protein
MAKFNQQIWLVPKEKIMLKIRFGFVLVITLRPQTTKHKERKTTKSNEFV